MLSQELKNFLDSKHVQYSTISHAQTYTAQEIAESAHLPGKIVAKTVMVKLDGRMAMAVLPATCTIDFNRLKEATGANKVQLAYEEEFREMFPDYETGAMPPFGNLFGMDVYVAESLAEDEEIAFNAGTHTDLVKMSYADFAWLTHPKVVSFSVRH